MFKNKRRHRRAESEAGVFVTCEAGSFVGKLVNISPSGIFATCEDPPAAGTTVKVEFTLPESPQSVAAGGTIIWIVDEDPESSGIGVKFTELTVEAEKIISAYVARCQISQR